MQWNFPLGARITKKEKRQALQEMRQYEQAEKHTQEEEHEYTFCWRRLVDDHKSRLRCTVKNLAKLRLLDALEGDTLEGDYKLSDYLRRYEGYEIQKLLQEINEAEAALAWLCKLAEEELAERQKRRGNVIPFSRGGAIK